MELQRTEWQCERHPAGEAAAGAGAAGDGGEDQRSQLESLKSTQVSGRTCVLLQPGDE